MFKPLKTLETKWNAHTPVYLHNGTKQNIIFQLTLVALMMLGFYVKDRRELRQFDKRMKENKPYIK